MAELVLSDFLPVVFEKLAAPILEEFGLLWGLRNDFEKLRSTTSTILAVLEDAEKRPLTDKAVQDWLKKLKYAAYDADDICDQFKTEALRRKSETQERFKKRLPCFFSASKPVFCWRIAHKIKDINIRFDSIAGERLKFHFRERSQMVETRGGEQTDAFVIESDVYGRVEDKERLVELLFNAGNEEELSVIPVVGMGGLGKTTLAQFVYNDTRLEGHFDPKIWVCMSDKYDLAKSLKAIMDSASNGKCDFQDVHLLQRRLQEILKGKKFLLEFLG